MALSNPSQLLLKNLELLESNSPLFVNCPDAELIEAWQSEYSEGDITCVNYHYGDHLVMDQAKVSANFTCEYRSDKKHDLALIYFPKSKAELKFTLAMIAPTLTSDALILFVGDNKGGIKTVNKLVTEHTLWCRKEDAAKHCSLFVSLFNGAAEPFDLADWFSHTKISLNNTQFTLCTLPGVFSHERLDVGTKVLLENLPSNLTGHALDFGCGAGPIAIFSMLNNPELSFDLIDVNALAIKSSEHSLAVNGLSANVFPSNSLYHVKSSYSLIISNPPFHQGIKTNYAATEYFLENANQRLTANGKLFVIANSFLKYKPLIEAGFNQYKELARSQGFTLHFASDKKR